MTNDQVRYLGGNNGPRLANWRQIYFVYLLAAIAVCVVGLLQLLYYRGFGIFQGNGLLWLITGVARLGLYSYAAFSLAHINEPTVRNFQIVLNGIGAFVGIVALVGVPLPFLGFVTVFLLWQ